MSLNIQDEALRPGVDDRLATPPPARSSRTAVRAVTTKLLGPLLLLLAWWIVTAAGWISPLTLPGPAQVWEAAREMLDTGALQEHLLVSLQRAMIGLFFGIVAGVVLALLSGLTRVGEVLLDSNLQMLRSMPILAMVPLAIVWFGIGEEVKVILVALGAMFPIYLNTHAAIRGVDARFVDLAATVGLGRIGLVRRVVLPGTLPGFFTGLRFSVAIAWLVLVVSEQINATSGVGYLMTQARSISATDVIIVGLVVYALLGLISDTVVRFIERKALTWQSTLNNP